MNAKTVAAVLLVCNLCLVVSSLVVSGALRLREEAEIDSIQGFLVSAQSEAERHEAALGRLIARLSTTVTLLNRGAGSQLLDSDASEEDEDQRRLAAERVEVQHAIERDGMLEKPDPLQIPRMTEEQTEVMRQAYRELPRLDDSNLYSGDIDALLADPSWNPDLRELSTEERGELRERFARYRYFSKYAHMERSLDLVQPEMPALRDAGAYIEYHLEDGPPDIEGDAYTRAEIRKGDEYAKFFVFDWETYPEINHHQKVSQEQSARTMIDIYDLINGIDRGPGW